MQLIKILKRKLSLGNPVQGAKKIKFIDDLLQREPLRKYVLFAKRFYESNIIFDQIAKVNSRKGDEK